MHLTVEQIRQGLLHPDRHAREAALRYFEETAEADESVMPVVIEAIDLKKCCMKGG